MTPIAKATARFVRISPRKVRYVLDLIRRKPVPEAQAILNGSPRRAGGIVRKLLNQAVDAAEKNSHVPARNLVISKITANDGPSMKRFRSASMGRASRIKKRSSHIALELAARAGTPPPAEPVKKVGSQTAKRVSAGITGAKTLLKKAGKALAGAK